ncbi:arginine--tRNA ligase [Carex littledalei]|uniref:arginine--tRNA ligase n=1 Tax=Carex littledalei TaxID=544730 RepID=A0A833V3Q1_9POAL|nr:arginine--tRNA ligase [Carex littledalei]
MSIAAVGSLVGPASSKVLCTQCCVSAAASCVAVAVAIGAHHGCVTELSPMVRFLSLCITALCRPFLFLPSELLNYILSGYLIASARRLVSTRVGNSSVVTGEEASTSSSLQAPSSFNVYDRKSRKCEAATCKLSEIFSSGDIPDLADVEPQVAVSAKFGDYQCNNAMGLWSKIKGLGTDFKNPISVGEALAKNLHQSEIIESTSVARPGFVNINLSNNWISKDMLVDGIQTWAPILSYPILSVKRAVVDFSSPNIAKEMHVDVGHLRSTIIGDTLARMFEFSDVDVLRRNHVGDWGTPHPG